MFPLETFDENGKPQFFVKQDILVALRGLIDKAVNNPSGFSAEVTEAEARALRDLGESKSKMEV
ncbi:hypothetical protein [Pseudomonas soli]|uniref:hypothetical protein n=1 Tax=Pseudomonas soli TaxID=1306993 RepID=UPI003DA9D67C